MTWTNQAESMMKIWTEAQRTMWQNWYNAVQATSTPMMFSPNMIQEWQRLATQGTEMWTGNSSAFGNVSQQLVASQAAMLKLLQMTTEAWQSMAPRLDAGQDWNEVLKSYVEQMRLQLVPDAKAISESLKDTSQLWQLYTTRLQALTQPWSNLAMQMPSLMMGAVGENRERSLLELTRLSWDAYGQTFGNLVQSPGFGLTRELEEKVAKAFEAWIKVQQTSNDYQLLLAEAWAGVFGEVLEEIKKRSEKDKPVESLRDLTRLWLTAADSSFGKLFLTENYGEVQGAFVTALMEYRVKERVVVEELMKTGYVPTRTEVDEAHRSVYELRRQVRALQKEVKQLRTEREAV